MPGAVKVFTCNGLLKFKNLERPRCPELKTAIHVRERSWSFSFSHTIIRVDLMVLKLWVRGVLNSTIAFLSLVQSALHAQSSDLLSRTICTGLGPFRQLHFGAHVHREVASSPFPLSDVNGFVNAACSQ